MHERQSQNGGGKKSGTTYWVAQTSKYQFRIYCESCGTRLRSELKFSSAKSAEQTAEAVRSGREQIVFLRLG